MEGNANKKHGVNRSAESWNKRLEHAAHTVNAKATARAAKADKAANTTKATKTTSATSTTKANKAANAPTASSVPASARTAHAKSKLTPGQRSRIIHELQLESAHDSRLKRRAFILISIVILIFLVFIAIFIWSAANNASGAQTDLLSDAGQLSADDAKRQAAVQAGASPDDPNLTYLPTPLLGEVKGVPFHCPISMNNLTEVEFHQASYAWALPLTSYLQVVDPATVMANHGTQRPSAQDEPTGDNKMIGQTVSMWRQDSVGPEMSSVDAGAQPGTPVYAPVTGTVVKIRDYSLYGELPDKEMHIQIPGHPELDFILLHIDNLQVNVGDHIIAGVTQVATVRDTADYFDDDLANFTAPGDKGNHTHLQVNDTTYPGYDELDGALNIYN
jgi:murein DD-endopeptidase MepM/ murein hydrolase activator NlpD